MRYALALMLLLATPGCSLMGIGDYDLIPCDRDETNGSPECDALNATLPADQCARYYCHPSGRGCVLEEHVDDESCDGLDNDCDQRIDEDAAIPDIELSSGKLEGVVRVSPAADQEGALHVVVTTQEGDAGAISLSHLAIGDAVGDRHDISTGTCIGAAGTPGEDCKIKELAIAATPDLLIGAGLHSSTCGGGQLRIAVGSAGRFELDLGETAAVVDLDPLQGCTISAGCRGAFSPAVAVLEADAMFSAEALVLWLATTASDRAECAASDDRLVAGLRLPIAGSGSAVRFSSSLEERSTLLSDRIASGPPQLMAAGSGEEGTFVAAFPSAERIELAVIPRLTPSATDALEPTLSSIEARSPSEIALAVGDSPQRGLAVAYRATDEHGPTLELSALALDRDHGAISRIAEPVLLRTTGAIVLGPFLSYAPDGFVTPAEGGRSGGWLVAWVERDGASGSIDARVMTSRVAEDGLGVLGSPTVIASGEIDGLFTYLKQEGNADPLLACGFLESEVLHVKQATCAKN